MALLLLSCGNKGQQQGEPSPSLIEKVRQLNDSSHIVIKENSAMEQNEIKESPTKLRGSSTYPTSSGHHTDNMRGFDPASEDDMDDNGMSRYMENYDDEGYD